VAGGRIHSGLGDSKFGAAAHTIMRAPDAWRTATHEGDHENDPLGMIACGLLTLASASVEVHSKELRAPARFVARKIYGRCVSSPLMPYPFNQRGNASHGRWGSAAAKRPIAGLALALAFRCTAPSELCGGELGDAGAALFMRQQATIWMPLRPINQSALARACVDR